MSLWRILRSWTCFNAKQSWTNQPRIWQRKHNKIHCIFVSQTWSSVKSRPFCLLILWYKSPIVYAVYIIVITSSIVCIITSITVIHHNTKSTFLYVVKQELGHKRVLYIGCEIKYTFKRLLVGYNVWVLHTRQHFHFFPCLLPFFSAHLLSSINTSLKLCIYSLLLFVYL